MPLDIIIKILGLFFISDVDHSKFHMAIIDHQLKPPRMLFIVAFLHQCEALYSYFNASMVHCLKPLACPSPSHGPSQPSFASTFVIMPYFT
jgi:hypothetical protein